MEQLDREDLLLFSERDARGHARKLKPTTCGRDTKKLSFPQRRIKLWNRLDCEVVCAKIFKTLRKR